MAAKAVLHPPASPFAELFRRSKFASFDPAIRQTYQAPPANAHRGDWGVKRPISLRRKNAFISLTSFEHHAHFTEWDHAENQVRFIRRIEEMGGAAEMNRTTAWYKSLGMARTEPPFDSDFCPGEKPLVVKPEEQLEGQLEGQSEGQLQTVNLASLGKRGPGAYGTQRDEPPRAEPSKEVFVSHNINAMSKREFKRYLRSLRAQRSEFQGFVNAEEKIKEKDLYTLSIQDDNIYHRRFLQSQMQKEYAEYSDQRIQPQPHPNGALLYTRPTQLENLLWSQAKPGFYLNDILDSPTPRLLGNVRNAVVSFGGITTRVTGDAVVGKKMLLDKSTEQGVQLENIEESILELRLNPFKKITIHSLPHTVGNKPQGLRGVKVDVELIKGDPHRMGWSNPHPLGSPDYIISHRDSKRSDVASFSTKKLKSNFTGARGQDTSVLLDTLSMTLKRNNDPREL